MKIVILGAGVIGVTTAYLLAKQGHKVVIIEKQAGVAEKCSFANGAQLSYCHAEPWAGMQTLYKAMKWLGKNDAPLLFRFLPDPKMWQWIGRFLLNCNSKTSHKNTEKILRLGLYSRDVLHNLEPEFNFDYDYKKGGKLFIFKNKKDYEDGLKQSRLQEVMGSQYQTLNPMEVMDLEPSLTSIISKIYAGIRDPLDESADIYKFSVGLKSMLENMGVEFCYNTEILEIETDKKSITKIITDAGHFTGDLYINCLGAYSPVVLGKIGVKLPIYPIKGYSISVPISNHEKAPNSSITDYHEKVVFSKLGNILRVAGTAEFAGYNEEQTLARIDMLKNLTRKTFPDVGDIDAATTWACLRPSTPDSVPIIGYDDGFENLMHNTGHGTLGWTQNFSSAQIIADLISGAEQKINADWFSKKRFNLKEMLNCKN